MDVIGDILKNKGLTSDFRNKHEFQAYGNRLAEELGDTKHRALYIKLSRKEKRSDLEQAREFALGYEKEPSKGKLFMWKLNQLKQKDN